MHSRNSGNRSGNRRRPSCQSSSRRCGGRSGFTLLELLLVLSILVAIGSIVMMNLGGAQNDAAINQTKVQINNIKTAISYYQIRMNSVPETLEVLRDGPSDAAKKSKWTDAILKQIPLDGWENDFVYSVNGNTYEIRSGGIDGQINTDDDIVGEGP